MSGVKTFNETLNPLYQLYGHGYEITTGKDFNTGAKKDRTAAVADLGVNAVMWASGEKALGLFRAENALEKQMLKNASAMGKAEKSAIQQEAQSATNAEIKNTVTTSTESKGRQLIINNQNSVASEGIVRDRLTSQLGSNEAILAKPRIYIGDGSSGKYAVPDFAIYNRDTKQIVRIVDAKDGNALPSRAQQQLNQYGGTFRGSSRARDIKPQSVKPGMLDVERTNVGATNR